jgi:hypothetical protein
MEVSWINLAEDRVNGYSRNRMEVSWINLAEDRVKGLCLVKMISSSSII